MLLLRTLYGVDYFIADHNFIAKSDLEFLNASLRILGERFHVEFCSPVFEKGIFLADFVAGIAKYIIGRRKIIVIVNNISVFMMK